MPINDFAKVGEFGYCTTYIEPENEFTYYNDGAGHYHKAIYVVDGRGMAETRISEDKSVTPTIIKHFEQGELFITEAEEGVEPGNEWGPYGRDSRACWITSKTGNIGCCTIMFNPIPEERHLDFQVVKGSEHSNYTVTAGENRITIVCVTNKAKANGKTLEFLQYAKVFPGNTVELELNPATVVILVTSERMNIDEKMGLK